MSTSRKSSKINISSHEKAVTAHVVTALLFNIIIINHGTYLDHLLVKPYHNRCDYQIPFHYLCSKLFDMYKRSLFMIFSLLFLTTVSFSQNVTDARGLKQGEWVRKYPNGNMMYEGTFKDDRPVGLFKRYNEEGVLVSELNYTGENDDARAIFFYPDGSKAAEGNYVSRKKEGLWKFYSDSQPSYLVGEEYYTQDIRNGLSTKYYPDGTVAERVTWDNGSRTGEWLQYYPDSTICLRAEYIAGKLEGPFSYYHPNGNLYYEGNYTEDFRTGDWMVFNYDGSLKQIIEYKDGKPSDPQLAEQETKFLDELEENRDKIEIVDITGNTIK